MSAPTSRLADLFEPEIADDRRAQRRVREWIAALRAGAYPQDRSYLRTLSGFCCLGVACDLFNESVWRTAPDGLSWKYLGAVTDLPRLVMDAYRLRRRDG